MHCISIFWVSFLSSSLLTIFPLIQQRCFAHSHPWIPHISSRVNGGIYTTKMGGVQACHGGSPSISCHNVRHLFHGCFRSLFPLPEPALLDSECLCPCEVKLKSKKDYVCIFVFVCNGPLSLYLARPCYGFPQCQHKERRWLGW